MKTERYIHFLKLIDDGSLRRNKTTQNVFDTLEKLGYIEASDDSIIYLTESGIDLLETNT